VIFTPPGDSGFPLIAQRWSISRVSRWAIAAFTRLVTFFHRNKSLETKLCLTMLLALSFPIVSAQTKPPTEYEKKAGWLFKFLGGTAWPDSAFSDRSSPYVLGVLGKDPFGPILNAITNKTVNGRPIIIKRCSNFQEAKSCHILFIPSTQESVPPESLDALAQSNILTIGESGDFTRRGGIINLSMDRKYLFEINAKALKRTGLDIKFELKECGRLVQ
jgi:hypothetical protein